MAGFATDATHVSSSGTALAVTGITNAFANAASLETLGTGAALGATTTAAGTVAAPQAEIDTLANILASCVNSNGAVTGPTNATPCYTLFNDALSAGSAPTAPSETATAAINIAHSPGANVAGLYLLGVPTPPFAPTLSAQPSDFTVALQFSGGALSSPIAIAIDGSGDAWIANHSASSITEISSTGTFISGANGYTHATILTPDAIAIDKFGRAWIANFGSECVTELSGAGSVLSGTSGYTGGNSINMPYGVAIDVNGYVWVTDYGSSKVTRLQGNGAVNGLFTIGGGLDEPYAIAFDNSSNAWITSWNSANVTELTSGGTLANTFSGGGLDEPEAIALDANGDAWATNYLGNSLTEIIGGSTVTGSSGGDLDRPEAVSIDGAGNPWVANYLNGTISIGNTTAVSTGERCAE